jgi:hypothetical protein
LLQFELRWRLGQPVRRYLRGPEIATPIFGKKAGS